MWFAWPLFTKTKTTTTDRILVKVFVFVAIIVRCADRNGPHQRTPFPGRGVVGGDGLRSSGVSRCDGRTDDSLLWCVYVCE